MGLRPGLSSARPQISFERCLGSATALSVERPSPFCHPERTRISCCTAFIGGPGNVVSLQREPHAADRSRSSRQEIRGSRGICGAPFVCPAPTGPNLHQSSPNPPGNTNLHFVIPGSRRGPRNRRSASLPGFPVEVGGVGELHALSLRERRTRNRVRRSVAGNPGRDDKNERVVARKGRLLNRGIFQIGLGQLLLNLA